MDLSQFKIYLIFDRNENEAVQVQWDCTQCCQVCGFPADLVYFKV